MSRTRSFTIVAVAALAGAVLWGGAGAYPGAASTGRAPMLRVTWRPVTHRGAGLLSNGRFVFAQLDAPSRAALLIDDQTGKRSWIRIPRGCYLAGMGGVWLLFGCGNGNPPQMKLYRLSIPGYWRALAPSQEIAKQCGRPYGYDACAPIAVGSHWVEYGLGNACLEHCTSGGEAFQSLDTGNLAYDPSTVGGTVSRDLNSTTLARHLCSPLRVPPSWPDPYDPRAGPGTVTLYGQFAVSIGTADQPGAPLTAYLEKCGSSLHELLQTDWNFPPAGGTHAIVWADFPESGANPRGLDAVLLPSLRHRLINLPTDIGPVGALAVGPHHLYLAAGSLYSTNIPALTGAASKS